MGDKSGIQWTEATWNPIVGCSVSSAGCRHCYAMREAARLERMGLVKYVNLTTDSHAGPVWNGNVVLNEASLDQPLRWRRPRMIFVNSMSDLFHEALTDAQIDQVFAIMALSPQHIFQVLTKRSSRMRAYLNDDDTRFRVAQAAMRVDRHLPDDHPGVQNSNWRVAGDGAKPTVVARWPLPNLWLGVSAEHQSAADARGRELLQTRAALRFLSMEPLLEAVEIVNGYANRWSFPTRTDHTGTPIEWTDPGTAFVPFDWIIVGGESGPRARPCELEWMSTIVKQCRDGGVPVFVKQIGANPAWAGEPIKTKHRKGADMAEWPEYLRIRQMPGIRQ